MPLFQRKRDTTAKAVSADRIDRHKAYLTLKPQVWDREVDHMIKQKAPNVRQGQPQGFEKILFQLQGDEVPEK